MVMGIVRLREWKSTGRHEAKALSEEEESEPAVLDAPIQRKNSARIDALTVHPVHADERVPCGRTRGPGLDILV